MSSKEVYKDAQTLLFQFITIIQVSVIAPKHLKLANLSLNMTHSIKLYAHATVHWLIIAQLEKPSIKQPAAVLVAKKKNQIA